MAERTPVALRCLGIFHAPPPAGSMSHSAMMAAANAMHSLKAKDRPLHMLEPPPAIRSVYVSLEQHTIQSNRGSLTVRTDRS